MENYLMRKIKMCELPEGMKEYTGWMAESDV
jgi:hypothetical protein